MKSLIVILLISQISFMGFFLNIDAFMSGREQSGSKLYKHESSKVVEFYETMYFDCSVIIPNNILSPVVEIKASGTQIYPATCENFQSWPGLTTVQYTTVDGVTRDASFEGFNATFFEIEGGKYLGHVILAVITDGPCKGDLLGAYGKYPIEELTKCILLDDACTGRLFEFVSTIGWGFVLGPNCGVNVCAGYDKYIFSKGLIP